MWNSQLINWNNQAFLMRMDSNRITKQMPHWRPAHRRCKRGRPRTRWKDILAKKSGGLDVSTTESFVMDKNEWKRLVKTAKAAPLDDTWWWCWVQQLTLSYLTLPYLTLPYLRGKWFLGCPLLRRFFSNSHRETISMQIRNTSTTMLP